jgi:hypothetical protein
MCIYMLSFSIGIFVHMRVHVLVYCTRKSVFFSSACFYLFDNVYVCKSFDQAVTGVYLCVFTLNHILIICKFLYIFIYF